MDPGKTTALIPLEEIPSSSESEHTFAPPEIRHRIHPLSILKKAAVLLLTGIFLVFCGICAFYAPDDFSFSREDVPAFLLTTLSAGQVHAAHPSQSPRFSAAETPDTPLTALEKPESDAPAIPAKEPSPVTFINETPYTPDHAGSTRKIPALADLHLQYGDDVPFVLILSTHGTEAYADHADTGYRTADDSENVIRIASVISETLKDAGIGVIHCRTRFDEEDFTLAYYNASLEIRSQLREYPSIQYIIDVHRDSVQDSDGTYLPMESDGLARLMFVVGTDHGGSGHTDWEDNLGLAVRLFNRLEAENPGIMRPINVRSASFNQQYTAGSLILEVGSCAGSPEAAEASAALFGTALAKEIIG